GRETVKGWCTVRKTAFAYIGRLWAERHEVDDRAVRGEKSDGIPCFGKLEADVEVRAVRVVLGGFIVGPHQQVSVGRDRVTIGNAKLRLVGQAGAEIEAGKVGGRVARIVDFKPILEVVVGGIAQSGHIV